MSAFLVNDKHIDALLTWAINTTEYQTPRKLDGMTVYDQPDLIGQILVDANYRSLTARYGDKDQPHEYKFKHYPRTLSPVEVIKACDCLNYQCCEFDEWPTTKAYRIMMDLREGAISKLAGMEEAAWEIRS